MAVPTRQDLNDSLDTIDQLKTARDKAVADAAAKTAAAAQAKADSDTAAMSSLAAGQALTDGVTVFNQLLTDYVAAQAASASLRKPQSPVPTSRR